MFNLAAKRLVWIPIVWKDVAPPPDDPDGLAIEVENQIEVLADLVNHEGLQGIFGGPEDEEDDPETAERKARGRAMTEIQRFRAVVSNWRGIGVGDSPAPFTDENIEALLKVRNFARGFDTSYLQAWSGQIKVAEKNLSDSSGSGPPDGATAKNRQQRRSAQRRKR